MNEYLKDYEEENKMSLLVEALMDVKTEVDRAKAKWPNDFHNAHEAYAVALEEFDELWDHVKMNQSKRNIAAMREEAVQAAAMLMRFITEICDSDKGRV